MIYLTDRARRFVESALKQFGDPFQKNIWNIWVASHPDSSKSALPRAVIQTALTVLAEYGKRMDIRIEAGDGDDDVISDLENDLAFIEAISRDLETELKEHRAAA